MRASTLALLGLWAGAVFASPIMKKDVVEEVVTATVLVTVTEDWPPAPTPTPVKAPVAPAPAENVVVVTSSKAPAPAPVVVASSSADPVAASPTAVPGTSSSDGSTLPQPSDYKSTVLYYHNIHRANHSAPPLEYDDDLAAYALTVAQSCIFAHNLDPGKPTVYGQNIAEDGTTSSTEANNDVNHEVAAHINDLWYNAEEVQYSPSNYGQANPDMSNFEEIGHFTAMVWKSTTKCGCATVYCKAGTPMFAAPFSGWYSVCNYWPEGNMGGEYGANVLPPLGHKTVVV